MILPSKKVLSILVITVALVVAIIITFGKDKSSQAINYASNLVAGEKVSIPENPNWQNELGVVGPLNKQTDTESASATVTDTLSTTLMSNYLALQQSGKLDAVSTQKLIDQSVSLAGQLTNPTISNTELNIISDNGKQTISDYGENLGNILKNNKPTQVLDESKIINDAITTKDSAKMNQLDPIIAVYEQLSSDLAEMPVPKTFVKAHLDLTNGIKEMAVALRQTKNIFNDPVMGLSAIQLYKQGSTLSVQAKQAIEEFINQNKIIYKQGSGGYYLLYGI